MNWLKYRFLYFTISGVVIAAGIFGLVKWGLKLGVDFTGGTIIEYQTQKPISTEDATNALKTKGVDVSAVQSTGGDTYLFRLAPITPEKGQEVNKIVNESVGQDVTQLRFETVGPSIGPELVRKTIYAIAIAAGAILLWVAYQFRSLKFGASAILAMFHDSFVLIGTYALLGHFFDAEVDFLFVTALLTTLSFSVHDTIVVYDRIRESYKKVGGSVTELANQALTETMVRSLNNSFTIVFMLVALILLGGTTTKWFAVALLIGTISGTYSSPFVAVPILVTLEEVSQKLKKFAKK